MKRFSCSDSLAALFYSSEEKKNTKDNNVFSREFQAMLDGLEDEDSIEETGQSNEKKRRLNTDQVKALEKIFEVDNKLDPERKVKLAQELGLKPRQVAIWFQNRRARWKTKQLEREFNLLKANYEALKHNYNKLEQEKGTLITEVRELKAKFGEENTESNQSHKGKALFLESQNNISGQIKDSPLGLYGEPEPTNLNHEVCNNTNLVQTKGSVDFKEGLSDSDSSGVLNEDKNLNSQLLISPALSSPRFSVSSLCSSSSLNYTQFWDSRPVLTKTYQQQSVKMEEQCLFSLEEPSCNIFSVDQAPTLCWYFPDQRN